jgi:hypothetical protein
MLHVKSTSSILKLICTFYPCKYKYRLCMYVIEDDEQAAIKVKIS